MATALRRFSISLLVLAMAACSYRAAPPEKRRPSPRYEPVAKGSTRIQRPSHYTVRRGDTLYAIAWRYGLDHRDLARWNRVKAPFVIHPDQALRLYPPRVVVTTASVPPDRAASSVRVIPQPGSGSPRELPRELPRQSPGTSTGTSTGAQPDVATPAPTKPVVTTTRLPVNSPPAASTSTPEPRVTAKPAVSGAIRWTWPSAGKVISEFSNRSPNLQGLDIGATAGSVVAAAAAGEVVYSGSGLAGYGELVIIKHSDRYLSAYAHNRKRFVNEGQRVASGEKIAEVGSNGAKNPRLHFQIRENGKPVNPRKYLPKR